MSTSELYEDFVEVKCIIEGVVFPYLVSVSIEMNADGNSMSFVVPDSPKLYPELLTGASVFMFYCDRRIRESQGKTIDSEDLPILCSGEIRSHSRSNSLSSRNISFSCMSSARHFSQTLLHFISPAEDRDVSNIATIEGRTMFIGNRSYQMQYGAGALTIKERLNQGFRERSEEVSDDERNLAYATVNADILKLASESASYRIADKKFKLSQRFGSYTDPDVSAMLELNNFRTALGEKADTLPSHASIKDLLDMSSELISYNWIHIAKPSLNERNETKITSAKSSRTDFNSGEDLELGVDGGLVSIRASVSQSLLDDIKSDIEIIGSLVEVGKDIRDKKIRLKTGADLSSFDALKKHDDGTFIYNKPETPRLFYNECIKTINSLAGVGGFDTKLAMKRALELRINEFGIVPITSNNGETKSIYEAISNTKPDLDKERLADILIEYASVPNLEFAQPPTCNVIFLSHIHGYNLSIDEFGSPTRMLATAVVEPSGIKNYYLAPSSAIFYKVKPDTELYSFSEAYRNRIVSNKANKVKK